MGTRLLWAVRQAGIVSGITSGIVAASATAGALLGVGIRLGEPARPFNALGALLLGASAQAHGVASGVTLLGVVVHAAAMIAFGLVYGSLVARSGGHLVAWAAIVAALTLATTFVTGRVFGVGLAVLLPPATLAALALVHAIALAIGMRLALLKV